MYTLISGSPKISNSNSMHFLNIIKSNIEEYNLFELKKDKYKEILDSINSSEVVVLAFPLYVDSPPSIVLSFLDYIIDNKLNVNNKLIYAIVNCGFRDGTQNTTAVNIIKRWCKKTNNLFGGDFQIGAGEIVGKDKYKFISKKSLKDLNRFANMVNNKQKDVEIITTMDLLNDKLYCLLANISWSKNGKKYKLSKSDLCIK